MKLNPRKIRKIVMTCVLASPFILTLKLFIEDEGWSGVAWLIALGVFFWAFMEATRDDS